MINVTGINLREAVKAAYDLSKPQGLGFLHFVPGQLTDEEADSLIHKDDERIVVNLDYVKGRACKFNIFKKDGALWLNESWYDHSPEQFAELLHRLEVVHP